MDQLVVYFIRHGEAVHNVAMRDISRDEVFLEKYFDARYALFGCMIQPARVSSDHSA
jgi:hypothetical protein